jgi:ABC-type nitrate/sulfonate/bicarbonate transport system substrate-binding protein
MKDKIMLATGHAHAFHRASALAAMKKGYFRDEGLPPVELKATGEDRLTVESLESGDIDFGLDVRSALVLEASSKGKEVYIIGGMLNYLDLTLIGTPDVKSVADLKGKKIGVIEKGGGREVPWIRMLLRKEGIDPDKEVIWVTEAGYGSLEIQKPRLDRGDYQSTPLTAHYKRPELFDIVRQAGYNILAERSETFPDGLPDRVVATTGKILTKYSKAVKSVLKGIIRGYRFARDPKNAKEIKEMYLTYDWGKKGFGWGEFDGKRIDEMVRSARILPPDGRVSLSGLDALIGEAKVSGKLPKDFTKQQVLRLETLQEAVGELNAKFGPEGY